MRGWEEFRSRTVRVLQALALCQMGDVLALNLAHLGFSTLRLLESLLVPVIEVVVVLGS